MKRVRWYNFGWKKYHQKNDGIKKPPFWKGKKHGAMLRDALRQWLNRGRCGLQGGRGRTGFLPMGSGPKGLRKENRSIGWLANHVPEAARQSPITVDPAMRKAPRPLRRNRSHQKALSLAVRSRDGCCRLTGTAAGDCDAAHIISLAVMEDYGRDNAILLTKTVHNSFDQHLWTFDPREVLVVEGQPGWCKLRILLSPHMTDNNLLRFCEPSPENHWFVVRSELLPALWVRFEVWAYLHSLYNGALTSAKNPLGRGSFHTHHQLVVAYYRKVITARKWRWPAPPETTCDEPDSTV